MNKTADIIKLIHSIVPKKSKIKIMNVCGSHEHTIAYSGIRSVIPENLEIIPGPGCPVCVCPESDIIKKVASGSGLSSCIPFLSNLSP